MWRMGRWSGAERERRRARNGVGTRSACASDVEADARAEAASRLASSRSALRLARLRDARRSSTAVRQSGRLERRSVRRDSRTAGARARGSVDAGTPACIRQRVRTAMSGRARIPSASCSAASGRRRSRRRVVEHGAPSAFLPSRAARASRGGGRAGSARRARVAVRASDVADSEGVTMERWPPCSGGVRAEDHPCPSSRTS